MSQSTPSLDTPNCWLLRSFSSLLLPLSCIDKDLVLEYFLVLYSSGRSSIANLLLALILMISPRFIGYPKVQHRFESYLFQTVHIFIYCPLQNDDVAISKTCVHDLLKFVIDSVVSKLKLQRYSIISSVYDSILNLAMDFAETAVHGKRSLKKNFCT